MKHPIPVTLSETDRVSLHTFIHAGKANARTSIRERRLYLEGGLEAVLHDKRQQWYRHALTGGQAAHLIAIICSPAPTGHDHWTLRLLAGKAVELGNALVHFTGNHPPVAQKNELKPWRKGC